MNLSSHFFEFRFSENRLFRKQHSGSSFFPACKHTKIALAALFAVSCMPFYGSSEAEAASLPLPENIEFRGGSFLEENGNIVLWSAENSGDAIKVTGDVTLYDFQISNSTDINERTQSVITIDNGSTLFLDRFGASDTYAGGIGISVSHNGQMWIEGNGTLKATWAFNGDPNSFQGGSAIFLTDITASDYKPSIDPASMRVNGVSLELLGDKGIRVDDGSHFILDNHDNPDGHVYIGVEEKNGRLVATDKFMSNGIVVVNGNSSVDIKTRDLKIYSSGTTGSYQSTTLLETSWLNGNLPADFMEELGRMGSERIHIEADNVDFRAHGGEPFLNTAIYAQLPLSQTAYADAEIRLKGRNFRLDTDWSAGIAVGALEKNSGHYQPNSKSASVSLDFDNIVIRTTQGALGANGNATLSLNAKDIRMADLEKNGYNGGMINAGYEGKIVLDASSSIGVTTEDPYLAVASRSARISMNAPLLELTAENGLIAFASGNGTVLYNYDGNAQAPRSGTTSHLTGDMQATSGGTIQVGLSSADSWLKGGTSDNRFYDEASAGAIRIHAADNATWYVRQFRYEDERYDSDLSEYYSHGRSVADLTTEEKGQNLNIVRLGGDGADFRLRTVVDDRRLDGEDRDHVNIKSGTGSHTIYVASDGREWTRDEQADYLIWHEEKDGAGSVRIDPAGGKVMAGGENGLSFGLSNRGGMVDTGVYQYRLATRDAQNGPGTEWYLQKTDKPSSSTDLVISSPAIAIPGTLWWAQLSDLRKRLGEVRYGAQDGLWARAITWEDNVKGLGHTGFHQKVYGLNLGLDRIVRQDEESMWLIGGNLKTFHAEQDIRTRAGGDGETDSWGLNLYATWADWEGSYADFVLSFDHYDQKMHTTMTDWRRTRGHYNTYGLGASIEIGKMFSSTQEDEGWGAWYSNWFVEPQAQLSYYWVKGKDYTLDNGMEISQDDGDSLTGRLGLVLGKKYNYGKNRAEVDKRYSQFYLEGGLKQELAGRQHVSVNDVRFSGDMGGTRIYYGAGFDWNLTDQTRLYAQIERENGNRYDRDYYITAGLKYQY